MTDGVRQRRVVFFSGMVQGVGFRYTAMRQAERFDITGTVRNLPDGRVELVAEGAADQVAGLVDAVKTAMGHYIRGVREHTAEATGEYNKFGLRW